MKKLLDKEIEQFLKEMKGWEYVKGTITKNYTFKTHSEAVGFIVRAALLAEKMNHHPNWAGVYNKVTIALSTHDVNGITDLDVLFAREVEGYSLSV